MKKIYYVGFYSDKNNNDRKTAPAADTKMDYILNSLENNEYDVEVISFCSSNDRSKVFKKYNAYDTIINNIKCHYFTSYASKYRVIRFLGRILSWLEQKKYINDNCINNDSIIFIYHSLALLKLLKYLNKRNKKYTLEIEEIYADVIKNNKIKAKEINAMKNASSYIFPTTFLNDEINKSNKPSIVVYGTYKVEPIRRNNKYLNNNDKNKIHCVYAGTFDPRKGGAIAALSAARYLPENYHIHIIGFGSKKELDDVKIEINNANKNSEATVSYDGLLLDDDYIKFLQSCDIGLSCQNPDAEFNMTSFPSKILSYLSNGLRVVTIKIPVIEKSAVNNVLFYYNNQNPQDIAAAIKKIDLDCDYDSRKYISELDNIFKKELKEMLDNL